jgi:hypothetical protein
MGLRNTAAKILDDVRFLTTSITSVGNVSISKIQSTASWLHNRLVTDSGSLESDYMLNTIQLAALIYSWSIMNVSPISQFEQISVREQLFSQMMQVSLSRWKNMPGIFLWILLVACPGSKNDIQGRFLRRKMAVAGMAIGLEDFDLAISYLRAFWLVQRWVACEGEKIRRVGK